ncbi:MAG TPA: serine/threonine-protein kinase, partial [Vicinamibacterales bacterium]|nr:serine/threonine-protein kinase [Vicinamibacterales bacterium]
MPGPPVLPGPPAVSGRRPDPANLHNRVTSVGAVDSLGTVQMPSVGVPGAPPALPGPPALPDDAVPSTLPTMASLGPPLTAPPSLPPARYKLGPEIARGGMGRVVDALDTRLGRTVAFKEALTADRDALQRFEREIRITARLEHPSIVPVHDAGESSGGAPFYVMRKVSGRPLEKLVASAETVGQRLALIPHIVNSAQAIAHAHERGIVHRDIKPSNILVGELGETVVIDWGLAKVIGEPEPDAPIGRPLVDLSDTLKTRAGIVYGTPGFMAPEQLCGAPVDERCDVYALGATLYHLLARTPPHHAKTADEMMKAAVAAPPTPIRELVPGVPLDLSTIVDKALAHDPTVRYQNARALAEDLQRFLTGQLVASHHYTPREKVIRFVRKNRGVSAAVAALIVVGSVLMVRIYIERNRAQRAEIRADAQRDEAERRAEELTLNQARYNVDVNPTRAVLMVKPLAAKYWREVRAIAAAAHAAGVAWSLPAAQETRSLEMSHDGTLAVSAGHDGVVRLHDLVRRTTRPVLELGAPALARFGDAGRRIVAWHDRQLVIADPASGQRRDIIAQRPITDLEVIGTTAYWVDGTPALWRIDLTGQVPLELPLDEPMSQLAPSPDGRWIALAGEHHLFFLDRSRPDAPALEMMLGATHEMVWSSTGDFFDALIDDLVISYQMTPAPELIDRKMIDRK